MSDGKLRDTLMCGAVGGASGVARGVASANIESSRLQAELDARAASLNAGRGCAARQGAGAARVIVALVWGASGLVGGCASPPNTDSTTKPVLGGEVLCRPDARLESMGNVAVATFAIEGLFKHEGPDGKPTVTRQRNKRDTMQVTDMFLRHLNGKGLTILDRQAVDARLKELGYSTSVLVEDETAPTMGKEYGAKVLIVGRYLFNAEGQLTKGKGGVFLAPVRVYSQSVTVKVFDLERATVLCDVERMADETISQGRLLPRSIARDAARKLLEALSGAGD